MQILNKTNKWLTLVELLISISILTMIIVWIWVSMSLISDNLSKWNIDIEIYNDANIFISESYLFRYNSWIILSWALLLYDDKHWIVLWAFDYNKDNYDFKLAATWALYSKQVFWYFNIEENTLSWILNNTISLYDLAYNNWKVFNNLIAKKSDIVRYNTWTLFSFNLDIFRWTYDKYEWLSKTTFIPKDDYIKLNFNF